MNLLVWKPSYSLGIPSVDLEHQEMIALINQAHAGLAGRVDRSSIEAMLGEIHAGIAAHFALEERLMRAAGYAEYAAHKEDHERLLEQILDLMDGYAAYPEQGSRLLSERLSDWFAEHFASFDARLHSKLVQPANHRS
jgi:hemerythrin